MARVQTRLLSGLSVEQRIITSARDALIAARGNEGAIISHFVVVSVATTVPPRKIIEEIQQPGRSEIPEVRGIVDKRLGARSRGRFLDVIVPGKDVEIAVKTVGATTRGQIVSTIAL